MLICSVELAMGTARLCWREKEGCLSGSCRAGSVLGYSFVSAVRWVCLDKEVLQRVRYRRNGWLENDSESTVDSKTKTGREEWAIH